MVTRSPASLAVVVRAQPAKPHDETLEILRRLEAMMGSGGAAFPVTALPSDNTVIETKESAMETIEELLPRVNVLTPRREVSPSMIEDLQSVSLSRLALEVFDCYDFPWARSSKGLKQWFSPFVSSIPERARYKAFSDVLIRRLAGVTRPLPEQNASLISGPVGCGKSTLTQLTALAVASLEPDLATLIHYECQGDLSSVHLWHILAAGALKAGLLTKEQVMSRPWSMTHLWEPLQHRNVVFFLDEAQLLFKPRNVVIQYPLFKVRRADVLTGEVDIMEKRWPRSLVSGSASSLFNLIYQPSRASPDLFPSKLTRHANFTKFTPAQVHRIQHTRSVVAVCADLERDWQLSQRAQSAPELERDPISRLPLHASETNRAWLRQQVEELSDSRSDVPKQEKDAQRAAKYLRRFQSADTADEQLLFFTALIYSRGVPRILSDLQASPEEGLRLSSPQAFVPSRVRSLWSYMASYLLLQGDAGVPRKLNALLRDLAGMDFPTQDFGEGQQFEGLSLLQMHIPTFLRLVPGAARVFPDREMLAEYVDCGYLLWDETTDTVSFASVADFALSRIGVLMESKGASLLSLLFNACGEEHERIAVQSIVEASAQRADEPRVHDALQRLGLAVEPAAEPLQVLWKEHSLHFPTASAFRLIVHKMDVPVFDGSVRFDTYLKSVRTLAKPFVATGVPDGAYLVKVLVDEAVKQCEVAMKRAFSPEEGTPSAAVHIVTRIGDRRSTFETFTDTSLLHRLATTRADSVVRSVHEAFGVAEELQTRPVIFKPAPDYIGIDWILLNPDGSLSVVQMKHGESEISERDVTVDVSAGAMTLRAWLGHRGVADWATTRIRRVVWCLRPTEESAWRKNAIPTGRIAASAGVEWLDKFSIAPLWSAEVVQVLFQAMKQGVWGVQGERARASVATKSAKKLARMLQADADGQQRAARVDFARVEDER